MANNSFASVVKLTKPQQEKLIAASVLAILATALGLVPFILVYLMAIALFHPPIEQSYIAKLVAFSILTTVLKWGLLGIAGIFSHVAAYNILYEIRLRLAEKFGVLPWGYFNRQMSGTLKKIMNEDVEYLELFIAHGIPEAVGAVATLLLTTGYLLTVDWRMTLAALAVIPVALLLQNVMYGDIDPLLKRYYAAMDRMNNTIIEYVQGITVIKAFTQTTESFAKYQTSVRDYHEFQVEWGKKWLLPWALYIICLSANIIVLLPVGVWLYNTGTLELPTFILFLLLGLGITTPLFRFMMSAEIFTQLQEGARRIDAIIDEPPLREPAQAAPIADLTIEFCNVGFAYENREVLQDISFVASPKQITAFVGPSGAGKTTIAKLIPRFWDIELGEILLGGVNIKNLKLEDLISKIAFVFQDVVLFNDTIYENIRLGNSQATAEQVIAAAKAAHCHEFIVAMPNGYQTELGERGGKLSGGQKQRIAIARAILKNAPIVILDEATAFIDPENEAKIQSAIGHLIQDKTLLIIAHRLSTITEADQILVVEQGKIVARGKHENLLQISDLYRRMWDAHIAAKVWSFEN